jgi:flavin-binding protein dodecin
MVCAERLHTLHGRRPLMAARRVGGSTESVARVTEITARSPKSFEDAFRVGVERATKTLRHVRGAWIKEQHVEIDEGRITGYQVNMLITFLLEEPESD